MAQEVVGTLVPIALAVNVPMGQTDARSFRSWKILCSTGSYTVAVYDNLLRPILVVPALVGVVWTTLAWKTLARAKPAQAALALMSTVSDRTVQALVYCISSCLNSRKGRIGGLAVGLVAASIGLLDPVLMAVVAVVQIASGVEMVVVVALLVDERWFRRNKGDY